MSQKEHLAAIAEQLPHGAFTEIAENFGCTPQYVSRFFNGDFNITEKNMAILDEAGKILEREKKAESNLQKKLNELLSSSK